MRSKFRACGYGTYSNDPSFPPIRTATELITRIAAEPRAARYIVHADMNYDDWPHYSWISPPLPNVDAGGPVVALFTQRPYLKRADLDWKQFYTRAVNDYTEYYEDSPYATAFALTLMPNIRTLRLAIRWDPDTTLSMFVDQIVGKAREQTSLWNRSCLSELTVLEPYCGSGPGSPPVDLNKAIPFLALPQLRTFSRPLLHNGMRDDSQGWDLCRFVAAIGRKVGSHLERLLIGIRDRHAPVLLGKASMRDFQRNTGSADKPERESEPLILDLVPASVSVLLLQSRGNNHHVALKALFRDFAAVKQATLPALRAIYFGGLEGLDPDNEYRRECDRLGIKN
ncbi:hypothetical protein EKO27_g7223 [Xylaria grammica]|uniref:Uncharacterized protein n=1 Tax=Xylaria grammica TaxID=363999 RepID=A0A439D0V2_9PEZI|nr:hypothetical protein EKO27_g7223 [Xylaria grammica]